MYVWTRSPGLGGFMSDAIARVCDKLAAQGVDPLPSWCGGGPPVEVPASSATVTPAGYTTGQAQPRPTPTEPSSGGGGNGGGGGGIESALSEYAPILIAAGLGLVLLMVKR